MENKIISKRQFEKALNICTLYQRQINDEADNINKAINEINNRTIYLTKSKYLYLNGEKFISEKGYISKRLRNALIVYNEEFTELKTIDDIVNIDIYKFSKIRNIGRTTIIELTELIKLLKNNHLEKTENCIDPIHSRKLSLNEFVDYVIKNVLTHEQ